jgi:hypothetical protein
MEGRGPTRQGKRPTVEEKRPTMEAKETYYYYLADTEKTTLCSRGSIFATSACSSGCF